MGDRPARRSDLVNPRDQISGGDVLEAAPDAIVTIDETGDVVQANRMAEAVFGRERSELLGRPFHTLIAARSRETFDRYKTACVERGTAAPAPSELIGLRKDGTEVPIEIALSTLVASGVTVLIAAVRQRPAAARIEVPPAHLVRERALYAEMTRRARKDPLTGLPNRAVLHDRLTTAIASARSDGHPIAVLFLDLDRFKHVNDSLGHGIGDWLLESVAVRLTASVGEGNTVSRQGGDEFVVLLTDVRDRDDIADAAANIMRAVTGLHRVAAHELHVTGSMGVAVYPEDGKDSETLIKNADIAMYHAKDGGRNTFQFFAEEMNAHAVERHAMEGSLRHALDRGEFLLFYQPKVALDTGAMIGAEALLRWKHPDRGVVAPQRFVPIAEDSGLIVPIGQWVLREACRQARAWQAAGLDPVPVAVNISAVELRSKGFLAQVRRVLAESGLDPRLLELELTESVLMESVGATGDVLLELKAMGLRLAVDDFGTGYSSLSYLTQFPIDALKVDQSFVRRITSQSTESPIITAVISMGRSLNHRVIAEGVETPEQLAFLQAQRCEEGQGFHFSRPLAAESFAALLTPTPRPLPPAPRR